MDEKLIKIWQTEISATALQLYFDSILNSPTEKTLQQIRLTVNAALAKANRTREFDEVQRAHVPIALMIAKAMQPLLSCASLEKVAQQIVYELTPSDIRMVASYYESPLGVMMLAAGKATRETLFQLLSSTLL